MAYSRFKSLTNLVDDATYKLRQAVGAGVQVYSADPLKKAIEDIYNLAVGDRWWPHLMHWFTQELDGSTGVPTTDLIYGDASVDELTDIRGIWHESDQKPLPYMSGQANYNAGTGAQTRCVEGLSYFHPNVSRLFRVIPVTTVGTVYVHGRLTPDNLFVDQEVIVPFNPQLLAVGAAWSYAASEGVNPAHVAKLQQEFADALKTERGSYKDMPLILDPRQENIPGQWEERWRY